MRKVGLILILWLLSWGAFGATGSATGTVDGVPSSVAALRDSTIWIGEGKLEGSPNAWLDTVDVKKKVVINDYSMFGIQYGVNLNRMIWNPHKMQKNLFTPINIGVMWAKYGKIFGYMPYFGLKVGAYYAKEGYNLDSGYEVQGARVVKFDVVEFTPQAHCHFDIWKMKIIVDLGPYVSYRLNIERSGDTELPPALVYNFLSTDHRVDYGIKAGAGFGIMLDPIEIHFLGHYKYGFANIYDADYYSQYYYRFGMVANVAITVGVHYQLTRREGKTKKMMRKEAYEIYRERKGYDF